MSQPGKQMIAIHILPKSKGNQTIKFSKSKGNQTIKFGQLIEYKMTNIFLKNQTQNVVEKLSTDPFPKNQS